MINKAKLNSYDTAVLESVERHSVISLAAEELGVPLKIIKKSYSRILLELKKQGAMKPIKDSRYLRSFCPRCLCPTRTNEPCIINWCETCSPCHTGCSSSSPPGTTGINGDPDAHNPSWKNGN